MDTLPIVKNDFGFRSTQRAGGAQAGEIGGYISRSLAPASYSRAIAVKTLDDKLCMSGVFAVPRNENGSGVLIGWFNSASRGWRSANSLAMRIDGNRNGNWVFFEYGTAAWRAGGGSNFEGIYQTTKTRPMPSDGKSHRFRLAYEPMGADGSGEMTLTLDGHTFRAALDRGHKSDGALFDRFGVFCQQISGNGTEVFFDDLEVNGERENFDRDPHWQAIRCTEPFRDLGKRPLQDFGLVESNSPGGKEILGGYIWRDESPAFFATPTTGLNLERSFSARGRVQFASAGSDSGAYFGWFDAATKRSVVTARNQSEKPRNQLAILVEGPSRAGHYFRPMYQTSNGEGQSPKAGPPIFPDGKWSAWRLGYTPRPDGTGRIVANLEHRQVELTVAAKHRQQGANFDHFGLFNAQTGGHYLELYLTDLQLEPCRSGFRISAPNHWQSSCSNHFH